MRRRGVLLLALAAACATGLLSATGAFASGGIYYVSPGGSNLSSCGSSGSPCATVATALDNAQTAGDSSPTLYVSGAIGEDNITISGSDFSGTVTIAQDPSAGAPAGTIKEAAPGGVTDANTLFNVTSGATVLFSGLTLDGDSTTNGAVVDDTSSGQVTVSDDVIKGAAQGDGMIADDGGGALAVTGAYFDHGGSAQGGGIWVGNGTTLTVSDTTFHLTSADAGGSDGGAIAIQDSGTTATVSDSTFEGNEAITDGGAIAVEGASSLTVDDSTFFQDIAGGGGTGGSGGAIYAGAQSTGTVVYDSTFYENIADNGLPGNSVNASADGNTIYTAGGAVAPELAGSIFYGTCALAADPSVDAYNVGNDGSCMAGNPASSDSISPAIADISGLESESGATAGAPQTLVPGAANPAAGLVPASTQVTLGGQSAALCPTSDEAGVASSGACNAGASQDTDALPTLYVEPASAGGSDSNSCASSSSACATISHALATVSAYSRPTVYVAGDIDENSIDINNDVTITQWPASSSAAVIDGSGLGSSDPLLDITGGANVAISGIAINNAEGGAVAVDDPGATVTFSDDTFADNANGATDDGGAIANLGTGEVDVENDDFQNNSGSVGGAIWVGNGGKVVIDTTGFEGGSGTSASYGGAIAVGMGASGTNNRLIVTDSSFTGLAASGEGGAIDIADGSGQDGTVSVSGSRFLNDTAVFGGVIANGLNGGTSTLTAANDEFDSDGSGSAFGGAILNGYTSGSDATAYISDSSFHDDTTGNNGGAIDNADHGASGQLTVFGSSFDGDSNTNAVTPSGGYGGAIDNGDIVPGPTGTGKLLVLDSTFANDTSGGTSELIHNDTAGGAEFEGNIFNGSCENDSGTGWLDDGYNVSTDTTCTDAGAHDVNAGSSAALDLGSPGGVYDTLTPTFASPVVGVIPDNTPITNTTMVSGLASTDLCPFTDGLGNAAPIPTGGCNAGAVQTYTPITPTGAATGVAATAGVEQATVSWTPPSLTDAGGAISSFTVTPRNITTGTTGGAQTTAGNTDSLVLTGLTGGDSYTFTVVTNNTAGSGPASAASSTVTLSSPPVTTTTTTTTSTPTTSTPTATTTTTTTAAPTTTTSTPPRTPATTKTTRATVGNQRLTLVTPATGTCLVPSKRATARLTSAAISRSKLAKAKFIRAVFTLGGKQRTTARHMPASVSFKLKGLKRRSYTVTVTVTYRESLPHKRSKTVRKTLKAQISVC